MKRSSLYLLKSFIQKNPGKIVRLCNVPHRSMYSGSNRPSGRSEFQNGEIFIANSLSKRVHSEMCTACLQKKMALVLCPAQILNESFNICISNQGQDADLCSCVKHSSGKDFEALQDFQTHSLPAFFFFFNYFSTVYILMIQIYTTTNPFLCALLSHIHFI